MRIIVVIDPDPVRMAELDEDDPPKELGRPFKNNRFICTCYQDVKKWCDDDIKTRKIGGSRRVWNGMGAHWYCIWMGTNDDNFMHWDMPRGPMEFEDRLWKAIEVYASFYEGIP